MKLSLSVWASLGGRPNSIHAAEEITGDTVFPEGVIGMLNCDGSDLADYRNYIHRLANLNIDMLFPGHRVFVLSEGQSHVDQAIESLGLLQLPRNFI